MSKKSTQKRPAEKGKELIGTIAPDEAPEGYSYYDFKDGSFKVRRKPGSIEEGYVKLAIEATSVSGDSNNPGIENKFIESEREGGSNRISVSGRLSSALGGPKSNHQAHHIIPDAEVRKIFSENPTLTGYDLDRSSNGIMMPCNEEGKKVSPNLPIHRGSHPAYNIKVLNRTAVKKQELIDNDMYDPSTLLGMMSSVENEYRNKINGSSAARINSVT